MTDTDELRGFQRIDPERRKVISSAGGSSVDPANRAFSRDRKLAAEAGRKGGLKSRRGKKKA